MGAAFTLGAAERAHQFIAGLKAMPTAALRQEWGRMFRSTAPHRAGRDLLILALAHKFQEQTYGGLSQSARRRLRSLAGAINESGKQPAQARPSLHSGARLVREWDRQVHEVLVRPDGFDYRGERYRSLTQIARHITGAHWSGPRFFGIAAPAKKRLAAAGEKVSVDAAS